LAAKPIAAPPSAAAMIGVALSPQEKALRLPLLLRLLLEPDLLSELDPDRFDVRFWVRVAISVLLG
jgi:hypothetical protein